MSMYSLAHIADSLAREDMAGAREHCALTMFALEQTVQDNSKWDLAFLMTLLEDPAPQLFATDFRGQIRASGPLRRLSRCPWRPPRWHL